MRGIGLRDLLLCQHAFLLAQSFEFADESRIRIVVVLAGDRIDQGGRIPSQ
ncbi:MAG: hypothetical protein ACLTNT_04645 [Bifidobacterium animalis]